MSVNSIADGVATFKLPVFNTVSQLKQPVKDTNVQVDSSKVSDAVKTSTPVGMAEKNSVRGMSHITESYDARGKVITKFMDSSNNVIYQTPSELVVKTQEMMTNTQAATNIKG
jgi:hypothetical protein